MVDSNGRLVAGPLRRGSPYCLLHAKPFMHYPAVPTGPIVLLLLDLETTGTDVGRCRIIEIAAAQAVDRPGLPGACFGQVVRVPDEILRAPEAQAASAIHGIAEAEITTSHAFPIVWARFLDFVERILNDYIQDDTSDSDHEEPGPPRMPDEPPALLVAAHNGYVVLDCSRHMHLLSRHWPPNMHNLHFFPRRYRFDFAVLLAEIVRHELALTPFRRWLFVDTLTILDASKDEVGSCLKLQCLVRHYGNAKDLRAHRVARA